MRVIAVVTYVIGVLACKKIASERVDTLELSNCKIAVPAGWNVMTNPPDEAPEGARVLVLDHAVDGFTPSIIIQQMALSADDHRMMLAATDEWCRDALQQAFAASVQGLPGVAKAAATTGFHGCDIEVISSKSKQSTRQISLSNGKLAISVVCNRDKVIPFAVDTACEAVARAITPK